MPVQHAAVQGQRHVGHGCGSQGCLLESPIFFCVKDSPQGPPPANRHQPPPPANRQPPPTAANRQPPPTANIVQHCLWGRVSCPCLDHKAESVPAYIRLCWRYEPFLSFFLLQNSPVLRDEGGVPGWYTPHPHAEPSTGHAPSRAPQRVPQQHLGSAMPACLGCPSPSAVAPLGLAPPSHVEPIQRPVLSPCPVSRRQVRQGMPRAHGGRDVPGGAGAHRVERVQGPHAAGLGRGGGVRGAVPTRGRRPLPPRGRGLSLGSLARLRCFAHFEVMRCAFICRCSSRDGGDAGDGGGDGGGTTSPSGLRCGGRGGWPRFWWWCRGWRSWRWGYSPADGGRWCGRGGGGGFGRGCGRGGCGTSPAPDVEVRGGGGGQGTSFGGTISFFRSAPICSPPNLFSRFGPFLAPWAGGHHCSSGARAVRRASGGGGGLARHCTALAIRSGHTQTSLGTRTADTTPAFGMRIRVSLGIGPVRCATR